MATTTGPLHSIRAAGDVAGTITFATNKGRSYVRRTVTPHNPQSAPQTGMRAMTKYLAQTWATLAQEIQATWNALAEAAQHSPYNAFTKENLNRWQANKTPTHAYPAAAAKIPGSIASVTATGKTGYATLAITLSAIAGRAGIIIYRNTASMPTPTRQQAIAVIPDDGTAKTINYTDPALDPATYYYRVKPFTDDGKAGGNSTEKSCTVT